MTYLRIAKTCPVVVKADGLAAGKGVIVCAAGTEGLDAVERIGGEASSAAPATRSSSRSGSTDRKSACWPSPTARRSLPCHPCQDHKRAFDGDTGPNTGGMGTYCPDAHPRRGHLHWIEEHVLVPTVHAMKRARRPFRGVLYAGLMITNQGPKVLEYNVRFGDPGMPAAVDATEERPGRPAGGDDRRAGSTRSIRR